MFSIKWLGVGNGFNFTAGNTSFLVTSTESNRVVLVDCGFTVLEELQKTGMLDKVTDILITHAHSDHIGGLELLGFWHYFVLNKKPVLHVATQDFAQRLWDESLKGGMKCGKWNGEEFAHAELETYFHINTGRYAHIPEFPSFEFKKTDHVGDRMDSSSITMSHRVLFTGDTRRIPDTHIYDCVFCDCGDAHFPGNVHISYQDLLENVPVCERKNVWLVHVSQKLQQMDVTKDGFAGVVKKGQSFTFKNVLN